MPRWGSGIPSVRSRSTASIIASNRSRMAAALAGRRFAAQMAARGMTSRARLRRASLSTAGYLGIDKKFYDNYLTSLAITAPTQCTGGEANPQANAQCLSVPATGDGPSNIDGNRYAIMSVQLKGRIDKPIQIDQTALEGQEFVFLALVLDTQTNGAFLNSEDVYTNESASAVNAPYPMRNLLFRDRFRVIKSKCFRIPLPDSTYDGTNIEQGGAGVTFDWYVRFKQPIIVNTVQAVTAGDITDVRDNSLQVIVFGNTTNCTLSYLSRIRFMG